MVHQEDFSAGGETSASLAAWVDAMNLLSTPSLVDNAVGFTHNILRVKPPYARETVEMLARVARALNPGGWEIVEGYRPPEGEDQEHEAGEAG